jgi:hypothetical protein
MASIQVNSDHDCEHGGGSVGGAIAVVQKASSSCCGAKLAEGGTDEAGHTCTGCGQATSKVMGDRIAHWTCPCGDRRQQVITDPQSEV